jgi:hypothetical protein
MLWKDLVAAVLIAVPSSATSDALRPVDPRPIPAATSTVSTMPNGGYGLRDSDASPPVRFQLDTTVRIATVSTQDGLDQECGRAEAGKVRAACIRGPRGRATIILPNPCLPQFKGQDFAWRLCHELGHKEGWGKDHEP